MIQNFTESPNSLKQRSAYSSNQSATSSFNHPPLFSSSWGISQWYNVTAGSIPAATVIRIMNNLKIKIAPIYLVYILGPGSKQCQVDLDPLFPLELLLPKK